MSLAQYIDDHPVVGLHGDGSLAAVDRAVYVVLAVKGGYFGYHFSKKKCALHLPPQSQFAALGLEPNRALEMTIVPLAKQEKVARMGAELLLGLRLAVPTYIPRLLARFLGLVMYLSVALKGVRACMSSLYSGLTGRDLHFDRNLVRHGWWRDESKFPMRARIVGNKLHTWSHWFGRERQPLVNAMIADIVSLMTSVAANAGKLWRLLGVHGPAVVCSVDSTLWQWGMKIRRVVHESKCGRALADLTGDVVAVAGGSFPGLFLGITLEGLATGSMELCGLLMTLLAIEASAQLAALFFRRVTVFRIDNKEVWWMLVTERVAGRYTLEKRVLLLAIYAVLDRLGVVPRWIWVCSKDNADADEPSRSLAFKSVRLAARVFARLRNIEKATLDAFSSFSTARGRGVDGSFRYWAECEGGSWSLVPYYSVGLDHCSAGVDALAQTIAAGSWVYAFPPLAFVISAAEWLVAQKGIGVLIVEAAQLTNLADLRWREFEREGLPADCVEWRSQYGWETVAGPAMVAVWFDFSGSPYKRARLI